MQNQEKHIFVGVSGGVDSSVALALLKEEGYKVTGVFLKVWSPDFLPCSWREERRSAMRVCVTLGVPFITLDCEEEYKKQIVDYMISEYTHGRTPNPDVFCNKYIKFGVFLRKALEMGATYIATGHYVQVISSRQKVSWGKESPSIFSFLEHGYFLARKFLVLAPSRSQVSKKEKMLGDFLLKESVDKEKDQSYFLCELTQYELSHALFPIGHLKKSAVRAIAEKYKLPTANKKDSQGLCFIGKVDMKDFLKHYIKTKTGKLLNKNGEMIGTHEGAELYTIGERHGFNIIKKTPQDTKLFVIEKNIENNTVTLGEKKIENKKGEYILTAMSWTLKEPDLSKEYSVRFRYRQEKVFCKLSKKEDNYILTTKEIEFGVASGQIAVIYGGEVCLGGGVIK